MQLWNHLAQQNHVHPLLMLPPQCKHLGKQATTQTQVQLASIVYAVVREAILGVRVVMLAVSMELLLISCASIVCSVVAAAVKLLR